MTQFVPMAVYQEAVANAGNAEAAQKAKEIDDLIMAACSDGRLTGQVTIAWMKEQAKPILILSKLILKACQNRSFNSTSN